MSGDVSSGIPWDGVLACASGLAFHWLSSRSGKEATSLKAVPRVPRLRELGRMLQGTKGYSPLIVAVTGKVGSDQPITCENSSLRGVIVDQTAEQFFLKHNDAGAWVQDSAFLVRNLKSVPWYIDDGTGRANVVGARSAAGLELTVGTEVFDDSGKSVVRSTVDYLQVGWECGSVGDCAGSAGAWAIVLGVQACSGLQRAMVDGGCRAGGEVGTAGLELTVGMEVFDDSGKSVVRSTVDYLQVGGKRLDWVLRA
ncbi:unnamed protein product [Closterium sp. Yama58-4]|nr:unnamed protein product [Closterium sp. Yama58-4]